MPPRGPGGPGGGHGGPGGFGGPGGGHRPPPREPMGHRPPPPRRRYMGYGRGGCVGCATLIAGAMAIAAVAITAVVNIL